MNPNSLVFASIVAFVMLGVSSLRGTALADDVQITIEEAREIALRAAPGTITEEDLEREKGSWVYEFEIETDTGEVEVSVDANTGAVVEVDHDD
jgi:uncharacterized membrane protein YkoI